MQNKGFTLLELIIVIIILSLVGTIGATVLLKGFEAGYASRNAINKSWQARLVLQRMTNELREAMDISAANNDNISFNNITYSLFGNDLMRNGIPIADSINALSFSYYAANNQVTANLADICCVDISADLSNIEIKTMVCPRNLL